MEFMEGCRVNDLAKLKEMGIKPGDVASLLGKGN
jgi:predicted unusual protein kinase regulating ubiquinone biosynthesis (AarF/ABC1/UbiB family)